MSKKGKIIITICIVVAAVCAAYLIIHFANLQATSDKDKALAESVKTVTNEAGEAVTDENGETVTEKTDETKKESETVTVEISNCPIDFKALEEINPEIYAWLTVSNTEIDFPVAQHEGESGLGAYEYYYLYVGYDLEPSEYGTLFTTIENSKDMSDNVTVIYGHNKSKFSELKNYRDESYWDGRRAMVVYTPEKAYVYKLWATVVWDRSFLIDEYNLDTPEGFEAFINKVKATTNVKSHVDETMDVTNNDKLLILSTCMPETSKKRYLAIGVLQSETDYTE